MNKHTNKQTNEQPKYKQTNDSNQPNNTWT